MASIEKFEDIEAWQKARILCREIYAITRHDAFAHDYGFCNQIRRAAVSILSNIAEGFERGGNKEFLNFLAIAKGSSGRCALNFMWRWMQAILTKPNLPA